MYNNINTESQLYTMNLNKIEPTTSRIGINQVWQDKYIKSSVDTKIYVETSCVEKPQAAMSKQSTMKMKMGANKAGEAFKSPQISLF